MATKVKSKPSDGLQISMLFEEDKRLLKGPDVLRLCSGARVSLDVETTGLEWWRDVVIGLGVHCPERNVSAYIQTDTLALQDEVKLLVRQLAEDPETTLLAHNLKFDAHFLDLPLWQVPCKIMDSSIAAHLYDSRLQKNLGALEFTFLGTQTKKELKGQSGGAKVKYMHLGQQAEYCVNDARLTLDVLDVLLPKLGELKLVRLFQMDMKHTRLLQRIERRGFLLDKEFIGRGIARFGTNLVGMEEELLRRIREMAAEKRLPDPLSRERLGALVHAVQVRDAKKKGKDASKIKTRVEAFNWQSDDQLSAVIYEGLGIPLPVNPFADADGVDRTKFATRGKYNNTMTSGFLLMEKGGHPLGPLLMDMRETAKLLETLEKWLALADDDGVLHTNLNPTGTRTGRLSSSDPNLQNVAGKERTRETQSVYSGGVIREEEYNLRLGLIARPGHLLLSWDHKQQEGRLFAHLSQDPDMIAAVRAREDIHGLVAKMVWADDIARDPSCFPVRREWAKTLAFGMLYGMTRGSMQHRLNKTQAESEAIMEQYQGRFKRVMPFLHETVEQCKRYHLLRYWSGRIWREDEEQNMYKGTNAQVQGGGSDLMRIAAMRIQDMLDAERAGQIIDIIHDENLAEVPIAKVLQANELGLQIMELEDVLHIPFLAESKVGFTYGSMMGFEKFKEQHPNLLEGAI